jgi:UDP-GlcNAc:undecaprenyl-phosphate GlcNAc-1-phosphate transferase
VADSMNPFFLLVIAVPASMLIIPFAWKLAPRLGMLDKPDPRKVHTTPIPRIGGWGIVLGTLLPIVIAMKLDPLVQSFVIGGLTLFLYGMWDDAKQISHWAKFSGQLFAAGIVVYYGDLYVSNFPFFGQAIPPEIGKPFTVFALMGMINAINHSDGLDGLAGGETMLSLIAIAYLGYGAGNTTTVLIAFAAIGGILGFLRYNTHPAQVFMGDAGSQFLGFTLGFLAVYVTQVAHTAVSPALPLLFLGLPISDIIVVLFKRIKGKMNWFLATRNHVHHRLLDLGFDHYETVVIIYSVQAALVTLAVLLRYQADWLVTAAYFTVVLSLFIGLTIAEQTGWKKAAIGESAIAHLVSRFTRDDSARGIPLLTISAILPLFMLTGSAFASSVPRDFGVVSGVLALMIAVEMLRNRDSVAMRLGMYVAAVFASYLFIKFPPPVDLPVQHISMALMVVLAVAISLFVRYSSGAKFGTTPTDYLIAFGVLALVVFGDIDVKARETVQIIMYSVVLLYACEAILGRYAGRWHLLNIATLTCLVTLAVRGLT